ncbi:hypothetical protein J6590_048780 [Homalodisca vitripennis]|nr:hypothetical protein J6590_048780 [Homalodisca vitripennis]
MFFFDRSILLHMRAPTLLYNSATTSCLAMRCIQRNAPPPWCTRQTKLTELLRGPDNVVNQLYNRCSTANSPYLIQYAQHHRQPVVQRVIPRDVESFWDRASLSRPSESPTPRKMLAPELIPNAFHCCDKLFIVLVPDVG